MTTLIYDGSFEGLLTAVFEVFEYKFYDAEIVSKDFEIPNFFAENHEVFTNEMKAERVLNGVEKICGKDVVKDLLRVFLSEDAQREELILYSIKYLMREKCDVFKNFADDRILKISKIVKSVRREKHRMEAFVRFLKLQDGSFYAHIEPDFDVLPLIISHFKNRYSDQKWMIYDLRRNYGANYDLEEVNFFTPDEMMKRALQNPENLLHHEEFNYENLWQNYFQSTNIRERKNPKLHLRHIPKRYWKYLTEKKG